MSQSKSVVSLVISRHAHDGAGAVVWQNILSLPNRNLLLRSWIGHILTSKLILLAKNSDKSGPINSIWTRGEDLNVIKLNKCAV